MKIEFDPAKAAANPLNHEGVTFGLARSLRPDARKRQCRHEHRFITLDMGAKGRILIVVWTQREQTVRLISA